MRLPRKAKEGKQGRMMESNRMQYFCSLFERIVAEIPSNDADINLMIVIGLGGTRQRSSLGTSLSECEMGFRDTLSRCPKFRQTGANCRILENT
jgi:hypothetical protein